MQQARATFVVTDWEHVGGPPEIRAGLAINHAHAVKVFDGQIEGRSLTEFTGAFSEHTRTGTYVAMESFEGAVNGLEGTFLFAHMNSMHDGEVRDHDHMLVIVPSSGTGELTGIRGTGCLSVDADGTHRLVLDYELRMP